MDRLDRVKANNQITRDMIDTVNTLIDRQNEVDGALIDALSEEDICTCGPDEACSECPDRCQEGCELECFVFSGLGALVDLAWNSTASHVRLAAAQELASFVAIDLGDGQGPWFAPRPKCL